MTRHYELRLQRAVAVDDGLPNVSFALLTLRWAMNVLGFQPDFLLPNDIRNSITTPKAWHIIGRGVNPGETMRLC